MKCFVFLLAMVCAQPVISQKVIDVNKQTGGLGPEVFYTVGGTPFVNAKFVNMVEGSPYFKDEWLTGRVVMPGGKEYKGDEIQCH